MKATKNPDYSFIEEAIIRHLYIDNETIAAYWDNYLDLALDTDYLKHGERVGVDGDDPYLYLLRSLEKLVLSGK